MSDPSGIHDPEDSELLPNGDAFRDANQDVDPEDQHDDAPAEDVDDDPDE